MKILLLNLINLFNLFNKFNLCYFFNLLIISLMNDYLIANFILILKIILFYYYYYIY